MLAAIYGELVVGAGIFADGVGRIVAMESFEQTRNVKGKRNLMMSAIRRRFTNAFAETVDRFDTLLNDVQDAGEKRGRVLHGNWGISHDEPDAMIWQPGVWKMDKMTVYGKPELRAILDEITRACADLMAFFMKEVRPHLEAIAERHVDNLSAMKNRKQSG